MTTFVQSSCPLTGDPVKVPAARVRMLQAPDGTITFTFPCDRCPDLQHTKPTDDQVTALLRGAGVKTLTLATAEATDPARALDDPIWPQDARDWINRLHADVGPFLAALAIGPDDHARTLTVDDQVTAGTDTVSLTVQPPERGLRRLLRRRGQR